jgi:hypothetical protein
MKNAIVADMNEKNNIYSGKLLLLHNWLWFSSSNRVEDIVISLLLTEFIIIL